MILCITSSETNQAQFGRKRPRKVLLQMYRTLDIFKCFSRYYELQYSVVCNICLKILMSLPASCVKILM